MFNHCDQPANMMGITKMPFPVYFVVVSCLDDLGLISVTKGLV